MNRFTVSLLVVPMVLVPFFAGCSSGDSTSDGGGGDAFADTSTNDPDTGSPMDATIQDTGTPDSGQPDSGSPTDGGATDAAQEAAVDGGPGDAGLPAPGSPCNVPNQTQSQTCGLCGTQLRACLPSGDGGFIWGSWGFCQGEVLNGCDPNKQYPDNDCGLCGKRKSVCLANCTYDLTQQCNEPMSACIPGDKDFALGLSCDAGGRERQCDNSCQFGNWSLNCSDSSTGLEVPNVALGTVTDRIQMLPQIKRIASSNTTCPLSVSNPSSTLVAFNYTRLVNNTGKTAVVSIWHSKLINGGSVDTMIGVYKQANPPADNDDAARRLCTGNVSDGCTTKITIKLSNIDSTSCDTGSVGFAGLMAAESKGITLAPNDVLWIHSSTFSSTVATETLLTVRTESLN